jgi:tRNA(fMet)-specific endonuclease VapC
VSRYLLDTSIVCDLVRAPQGRVAARVADVGEARICTSVIVAAELGFGGAKKGSARLTAQLEAVLGALDVLPLAPPANEIYGSIRAALERGGVPIGGNDLLIAAHALALGHTLVTDNAREFRRVPELPVENWLR